MTGGLSSEVHMSRNVGFPTDLESQTKLGKIKLSRNIREHFLFLQKVRELIFLNANNYHVIKKCCDFHLKNVTIIISCSR